MRCGRLGGLHATRHLVVAATIVRRLHIARFVCSTAAGGIFSPSRRRGGDAPLLRRVDVVPTEGDAPPLHLYPHEEAPADDDDDGRPEHTVYHLGLGVTLLRDHLARLLGVEEALEAGAALHQPTLTELLHRFIVLFPLFQADTVGALKHTI